MSSVTFTLPLHGQFSGLILPKLLFFCFLTFYYGNFQMYRKIERLLHGFICKKLLKRLSHHLDTKTKHFTILAFHRLCHFYHATAPSGSVMNLRAFLSSSTRSHLILYQWWDRKWGKVKNETRDSKCILSDLRNEWVIHSSIIYYSFIQFIPIIISGFFPGVMKNETVIQEIINQIDDEIAYAIPKRYIKWNIGNMDL